LLVNFDYKGTLIKELDFKKSAEELLYQLERDQDVIGRLWALGQLNDQLKIQTTAVDVKNRIASAIAKTVKADKFWGLRLEAATALASFPGPDGRDALLAATKDSNPRVRARAITSLAASKDPTLAGVYQGALSEQSYAVIKAAALALGQTRDKAAYEALVKLLDVPSWKDTIRVSGLNGLAALGDQRAADRALKYVAKGNRTQVRAAAVKVLGEIGKEDPRTFAAISETLEEATMKRDLPLTSAAAEALSNLGDARGLQVFERLTKNADISPQFAGLLMGSQERLRKSTAGAQTPTGTRP
jgi:aminopeptidase N